MFLSRYNNVDAPTEKKNQVEKKYIYVVKMAQNT